MSKLQRAGGTPVLLRWKRRGGRNSLSLSTCRACEWLTTYLPEVADFLLSQSRRGNPQYRRFFLDPCPSPAAEGEGGDA